MSLVSPPPRALFLPAATMLLASCSFFTQAKEVVGLVAEGDSRDLRKTEEPRSALTERRPDILILAIDGVDRDLLYSMLRKGELPGLSRFLGRRSGDTFAHAHLDDRVLSIMPTSTAPAWASLYTASPPSVHGVVGNEFFIREKKELAAPVPTSFLDATPVLTIYTEDYADGLLEAPTIYERIRARDPGIRIWAAMCMYHRGADRLLMARRSVLGKAFHHFLQKALAGESDEDRMAKYAALDREVLTVTGDEVAGVDRDEPLPDILAVYISGADSFGHKAEVGSDAARRIYLKKLDPELNRLYEKLLRRGALDDRFVVIVSDHGQAETRADNRNALGDDEGDEPPAILEAAGFRVRAREWKVPEGSDYNAVFAYGGPNAYVYLADRSTCAKDGAVCDFTHPPRFQEDVVPAADALLRASQEGLPKPGMRGTIDLVLTRHPRAIAEEDEPFQVYLGGGKMEEIDDHLRRHPRHQYLHLAKRLRELAVGVHGERAGDIMLISNFAAEREPTDRYYFGHELRAEHGGPSRKESEIPFVLAHPKMSRAELARVADRAFGESATLSDVGKLVMELRLDDRRTARARRR